MINVYSIYDKAAGKYSPPFVAVTDAVAVRQLKNLIRQSVDPQDYSLYQIGEFSDDTAAIGASGECPRIIIIGGFTDGNTKP